MIDRICIRCGGIMEAGWTTAKGFRSVVGGGPRETSLVFVVPGSETSSNLIRAFRQGQANEPADRIYPIVGFRCAGCGALELFAEPPAPSDVTEGNPHY